MRPIPFIVLALLLTAPAAAAEQRDLRLVTVAGEADVKVAPDEVVITVGIETPNKDLNLARSQNSERVKRLTSLAAEFHIDPKDIGTNQITLEPRYDYNNGRNDFRDYLARRTVSLTLKDLSRFEGLLAAMLKAGVTSIQGAQFCTSALRKYKDQARSLAIKAAQEKARDLAKELGQKIGRPHTIQEDQVGWSFWDGGFGRASYGNAVQNVVSNSGEGPQGATPAVGQISITARVTVSFELE